MVLESCPFCDGNAITVARKNTFNEEFNSVQCMECGVRTPEFDSKTEAVLAWNTRPVQYGVWIPGTSDTGDALICSICGCRWDKMAHKKKCPNCGTEMISKKAFIEWKGFPNKVNSKYVRKNEISADAEITENVEVSADAETTEAEEVESID